MKKHGGDVNKGFEWLKKLDANTKEYTSSPEIMYNKLARGEALVTVWNMPDTLTLIQEKKYPFGYVIPKSGTPIITEGIAIIKGAKHPKAAQAFYEFVNSPEAAKILAEKYYRIPTRTDVTELPEWVKQTKITEMDVDYKFLKQKEKEWMDLWDTQIKGKGKEGK
jgi:iron(III) transport system substrate-binding protein